MDYLDFVEEHGKESSLNLFDKVRVMSKRARDLYAGKSSKVAHEMEDSKPIAIAQYEMLTGVIEPEILEIEDPDSDLIDDLEI